MNRTLRGIPIDLSDEYENASDSIRTNGEFDSNEIDESDLLDEGIINKEFQHSVES
jgi:hypothetical protein